MSNHYQESFIRNIGIFTESEQEQLKNSTIGVAGVGGVGGLLVERLIRLGVGNIKITDLGTFDQSNLNRQYGSSMLTLERDKAEVVYKAIQEINPEASIYYDNKGIISEEDAIKFVDGWKIYLFVIFLVVTLVFLFITRDFFISKDFTAVNVKDTEIIMIASKVLDNHELKYAISENLSETLITLDQGEAVIKIKPEGIVSTLLSVKFIKFNQIYSYEDIIADLKEQINKTTKVNPFRGLIDLVLVIPLLAFIFWMNTKMNFF